MKTVFHVNDAQNLDAAVANIENLLVFEPIEQIILVINGPAIKVVKDSPQIVKLVAMEKVTVYACNNAMKAHDIEYVLEGVKVVPAGVYSLTQLQLTGFAYIKP